MSRNKKYLQIVKVLHDNFCHHLAHMKSAQEAAESFAAELGRFIETGTMSRKTRSFVEFEIRNNWEDYKCDEAIPACDKKTLKISMADGDCQAEKIIADKCLFEWNGTCLHKMEK